jgi:hypothetical protein
LRTCEDTPNQARAFSPHLQKFTSIEHCHFGSNHSSAAPTQRYTTVLHNQAIDSTPTFVEIALEVTKIHPIKREPSPPPPKIPLDHTLSFRKQSRRCRHPLTTPNDPSPPGHCQHSNSCENCLRTCEDTSNLLRGPTYTFQNHTTIFLEDQSLTNCPPTMRHLSQHYPLVQTPP